MQPLNTLPKYNMFGLEKEDYDSAKIVVLPIPYDSTVTYKSGTREGPRAIIEASRNMELYSYELGCDISEEVGIFTMDELAPDYSSPENMVKRIAKEISLILETKKVPLILGGEHTVTIGALQALKESKEKIGVIQFDAHSDTRNSIFNSKYVHSNVMTRGEELFPAYFNVGVRSIDSESAEKKYSKNLITMRKYREMKNTSAVAKYLIDSLPEKIYISIDLDVLDPYEMPSVGTPEPDGLRFMELTQILEEISKSKKLVGLDIVELCPIQGVNAPNYLAAKLVYLTIGYFFAKNKKTKA